jgi:hypothetical protein
MKTQITFILGVFCATLILYTLPPVYGEQCYDLGFCVHPQPSDLSMLSVAKNCRYFVSLCSLQNFFVWIGVAIGAFSPVSRFSFLIAENVVPVLGPLIFGPIRRLIPEPESHQYGKCLVAYLYAPILWTLLLWLYGRLAWYLLTLTLNIIRGRFSIVVKS